MDVENLEYATYILGIIICIFILLKTVKNYKLLKNKYVELQASIYLPNCQKGLLKTKDFFKMKNDGISLCKPLGSIEYVEYIGKCNIFMEKKI